MINNKLIKSMLLKNSDISEVVEVSNGADAIEVLNTRFDINVVLLDVIMPIMGGMETLQVIRSDKRLENVIVIMLTTDETKRAEALRLGANDFVRKPIKATELIAKLHHFMK
jgi:putative two-component system response regulator